MQGHYKDTKPDERIFDQYRTVARHRGIQCGTTYIGGLRNA